MKYLNENMLESTIDIIIHGCNCFHTMGAGIAKQIKALYPEAYEADLTTEYASRAKLGTFSFAHCSHIFHPERRITIVNVYSQYRYGREKRHADYVAIAHALTSINLRFKKGSIGLPKIGCGLAGGDWTIVKDIVEKAFQGRDVTIFSWRNNER